MLEVHDRMHKLWKQGKENNKEYGKIGSRTSDPNQPLTLEMAVKEWLDEEEQWERDLQTEMGVLSAVADEFFANSDEFLDGASLLCFDEVQASV